MEIRPDALIPLVGAVVNLGVALFVFFQNPRSTVGRVFFLLGVSFAVWNFGTYQMFRLPHAEENIPKAIFWARFIQFGVIWIPLTLCHVSFLIAGIKMPRQVWWVLYVIHAAFFLSNFTTFVVKGVKWVGYAWYCEGDDGHAAEGINGNICERIFVLGQNRQNR